jgi:hypothetical protein
MRSAGGRWLGPGLLAAALVAGCGSSSSGLKLTAYVVHGSQETGFSTQGAPTVTSSLDSYLSTDSTASSDRGRLKAEGFAQFATVGTGGPNAEQGGSFALALGSTSAAASEQPRFLTSAIQAQRQQKLVRFTVPGVPGATGVRALGTQPSSNVYWQEGRCVLWVGDTASPGPVIAAAQAIWATTHGRKGACAE